MSQVEGQDEASEQGSWASWQGECHKLSRHFTQPCSSGPHTALEIMMSVATELDYSELGSGWLVHVENTISMVSALGHRPRNARFNQDTAVMLLLWELRPRH